MRVGTPRLIIRTFELRDAEPFVAMFRDPDVNRYLPAGPRPTLETFPAAFERRLTLERERGFSVWAVELKETGSFIGQSGLYPAEGKGPEVELAYHFYKAAWNKGYATEAAVAVLEYAFAHTDLDRIVAFVMPANAGSRRVLEKAGMRSAGDVDVYGLTGVKKYFVERAWWIPPRDVA